MRTALCWTALLVLWTLCLGASAVTAQVLPAGLGPTGVEWPLVMQGATVLGGAIAVIVRINEGQKQSAADRERMVEMWRADVTDIRTDLKAMRAEMFSRHEVEEARRTATSEHAALSQRITMLEQRSEA